MDGALPYRGAPERRNDVQLLSELDESSVSVSNLPGILGRLVACGGLLRKLSS
jgi:hypothetical protein